VPGDAVPPQGGPPLLPTERLTWDELEAFVDGLLERFQRLPGASPRLVSSSRFGRSGDDQEGIDLYGSYDDGSTATWQCKAQLDLTAANVRSIVATTEVEADRHIIVFGRLARAAARAEESRHAGWEIWDQRDLTNKVRSLPVHEAIPLIDAHFGVTVRRTALPNGEAFVAVRDYFAPLMSPEKIFHHRAALTGRTVELSELQSALDLDAGAYVVVLSGPGGRGKSRLAMEALQALAAKEPARPQIARDGSQPLDSSALGGLPHHPAVILVEDAQRDPAGLAAILGYARRTESTTVLVTCRPSATPAVREALIQAAFDTSEFRILDLTPLDMSASRDLVRQLAADANIGLHEDFAEALAGEGRGCPLVPVVAISMLADGTMTTTPPLDAGFRQQILDRFGDVMRTGIPEVTAAQAADTLAVVAALTPVSLDDDTLLQAISEFLGIVKAVLLARVERLVDHGVLVERDRAVRVVPDVLGDESLTKAAVRQGTDTGYVDRLWSTFGNQAFGVLARNIAELGWRIRGSGSGLDLLGTVWADIQATALDTDARGRNELTSMLRDLAGPQPERVVHVISALIADKAAETTVWPGHTITDAPARRQFAPILGICARTGDAACAARALDLLWELGRVDQRPTTEEQHALRVLADLAQITPERTLRLPAAILESATRWLSEPARTDDTTTALSTLEPLVAKEGTRDRWDTDGRSVTITPYLSSQPPWRSCARRCVPSRSSRAAGLTCAARQRPWTCSRRRCADRSDTSATLSATRSPSSGAPTTRRPW
jgi:hypothetical protein